MDGDFLPRDKYSLLGVCHSKCLLEATEFKITDGKGRKRRLRRSTKQSDGTFYWPVGRYGWSIKVLGIRSAALTGTGRRMTRTSTLMHQYAVTLRCRLSLLVWTRQPVIFIKEEEEKKSAQDLTISCSHSELVAVCHLELC